MANIEFKIDVSKMMHMVKLHRLALKIAQPGSLP